MQRVALVLRARGADIYKSVAYIRTYQEAIVPTSLSQALVQLVHGSSSHEQTPHIRRLTLPRTDVSSVAHERALYITCPDKEQCVMGAKGSSDGHSVRFNRLTSCDANQSIQGQIVF